jgi:perosamine synthetase
MSKLIPHNKPNFDQREMDAVCRLLEKGYVAQGEQVAQLEKQLSNFFNRKYSAAVSSGTMALALALKSLKIQENDEVIIPSYTCSALYHAVKFCNGEPIYADIEPETCNLSPDSVKQNLTAKTKAIIFPHMFGQPGYIIEVKKLGVPVIEDIAQAIGAKIRQKLAGSFGDITVLSFYATKMLGAGEGGVIMTDNSPINNYVKDVREYDEADNLVPRFNAKMTDITAAIALEQLAKLDHFIQKRKQIHNLFRKALKKELILPIENETFTPNYFRQIMTVEDVEDFIQYGKKERIQFRRPVHKPLHLYENKKKLPITEKMWKTHISLPIFTLLQGAEITRIINSLKNYEKIHK